MPNNRLEKCSTNNYPGSAECYACKCADLSDPFKDIICRCPPSAKSPNDIDILEKDYIEKSKKPTPNGFIEYLKNLK